MSAYLLHIAILVIIFGIVAESLGILVGQMGFLSLGHGAVVGLGAYACGIATSRLGISEIGVAAPISMLAGGLAGAALGGLTSAQRRDYVVLSTLAFELVVVSLFRNVDDLTGGARGLSNVTRPSLFGISMTSNAQCFLGYFLIALCIVMGIRSLYHSRAGLVLQGIRGDEIFIASLGYQTRGYRIMAFGLSGAIGGIGGMLYASYITFIEPSQFDFMAATTFLAMVLIGGAGRPGGPWVGAGLLVIMPEILRLIGVPLALVGPGRQLLFGALIVYLAVRGRLINW